MSSSTPPAGLLSPDASAAGELAARPLNSNSLLSQSGPKLFSNGESGTSGAGTPVGFQRHPHNKILENVVRSQRLPSPQPTHLGIPGGSPHRVLSEEDPGYIAAKFEGKQKQMEQGELAPFCDEL